MGSRNVFPKNTVTENKNPSPTKILLAIMANTLGIVLGMTNSCLAVINGGVPLVLENSEKHHEKPVLDAEAMGEHQSA